MDTNQRLPVCSASRSVIMPSETGLVTAVLDGHTLTSPTAYYSFDAVSAENYSPPAISWLPLTVPQSPTISALGPFLTNVIVPVMSADVSTIPAGTNVANAVDWSNFNAPVPLLPYIGGYQCGDLTDCRTVYEDDYAPMIAVPLQALNLDPAWSTCQPDELGVYDPPHALQAAPAEATPINTFTGKRTTFPITKAAPEPGPTTSTLQPTSIAATEKGGITEPEHSAGDPSGSKNRGSDAFPSAGENTHHDLGSNAVTGEGKDGSLNSNTDPGAEKGSGRNPDPGFDTSKPGVGEMIASVMGSSGSNGRSRPNSGDTGHAFDLHSDPCLDIGASGLLRPNSDDNPSPHAHSASKRTLGQAADAQDMSSGDVFASVLGLSKLFESDTASNLGKIPESGGSEGSDHDSDESPGKFDTATSNSGVNSDITEMAGNSFGNDQAMPLPLLGRSHCLWILYRKMLSLLEVTPSFPATLQSQ